MSDRRGPTVAEFRAFFKSIQLQLEEDDELIWVSNRIPVNALRASYPLGIFPWPGEDPDLFPWVTPLVRGVLPLEKFHLGKSTRRSLDRAGFRVTKNTAFRKVIEACHTAHEPDSWIHPLMRDAYTEAHQLGFAHSYEVWEGEELVGGLYGIDSGHFFSGESMFHKRPNATKAAIAFLVEERKALGNELLDIQQLTPHMERMGAEEWDRDHFLQHILGKAGPTA